ncbi:uncharacterized protein A4U43_C05F13790 [Asparagus officinalis]|uniref:Uncharacterized protein n=1 Tax=Asparagus officinalis TaxID=4686 RepID=A0A5P1EU09_ASPOF|nr:uncharacterized protein A4U43_C05F13790 [Asparagus officinalis]
MESASVCVRRQGGLGCGCQAAMRRLDGGICGGWVGWRLGLRFIGRQVGVAGSWAAIAGHGGWRQRPGSGQGGGVGKRERGGRERGGRFVSVLSDLAIRLPACRFLTVNAALMMYGHSMRISERF